MKCVMEVKPMDGKPDMGELLRKVDFLSGENERLNRENARLKGILSAHGIAYRQQYFHEEERSRTLFEAAGDATESQGDATGSQNHGPLHGPDGREGLTVNQILQQRKDLFRSLFKGREDVFATRWTSRDGSRSLRQAEAKVRGLPQPQLRAAWRRGDRRASARRRRKR